MAVVENPSFALKNALSLAEALGISPTLCFGIKFYRSNFFRIPFLIYRHEVMRLPKVEVAKRDGIKAIGLSKSHVLADKVIIIFMEELIALKIEALSAAISAVPFS